MNDFVDDWRASGVSSSVAAMLDFAERLTDNPAAANKDDLDALRAAGWDDVAIHDAVQVIAYFNYINRVADALGVAPEPNLPQWGTNPSA